MSAYIIKSVADWFAEMPDENAPGCGNDLQEAARILIGAVAELGKLPSMSDVLDFHVIASLAHEGDTETRKQFDAFYAAYPKEGRRKSLKTEWENFTRKKGYRRAAPLLLPAIEREKQWRVTERAAGRFVPSMKHMQTWINGRCWEYELNEKNETPNNYGNGNRQNSPTTGRDAAKNERLGSFATHIAAKLGN